MQRYRRRTKIQQCPDCPTQFEYGKDLGRDQVAQAASELLAPFDVHLSISNNTLYINTPNKSLSKKL
jgi:hypothetical protein